MSKAVSSSEFSKRGLIAFILNKQIQEQIGAFLECDEGDYVNVKRLATSLAKRTKKSKPELLAIAKSLKAPLESWGSHSTFLEDEFKRELQEK